MRKLLKPSIACVHRSPRFSRLSFVQALLAAILLLTLPVGASSQVVMHHSTARSLSAIDTLYPFDIPLLARQPGGDTTALTSEQVLSTHLGQRPVVLMFWLTTCGPCRLELHDLQKRMQGWKEAYDFAFVPVSIDFPRRRQQFHQRASEYPWTSYLDENREFPLVMPGRLNGVPQIFVYDQNGKLIFHRRKYRSGDLEALEAVLAGK